jgi:protein gp37
MGENSKISWTHDTFNPWWVCTNISPGCDHCYAEMFAHRMGYAWGKDAPRLLFGEKHWNEPYRWARAAKATGERRRVFCASMADILDTWTGDPIFSGDKASPWYFGNNFPLALDMKTVAKNGTWLNVLRELLWAMIEGLSELDWLLLTKRPQGYRHMLPQRWVKNGCPPNVWLMTTVESREYAWRIDEIAKIPAVVHGVSWEPALGYVDFRPYAKRVPTLWVIGGGESGPGCRPFNPEWTRRVARDLASTKTPYFLKQLGGWPDKRDNPALWESGLAVQQFPVVRHPETYSPLFSLHCSNPL